MIKVLDSPNAHTFAIDVSPAQFSHEIFEATDADGASKNGLAHALWTQGSAIINRIFIYKSVVCLHKKPEADWGNLQTILLDLIQQTTLTPEDTKESKHIGIDLIIHDTIDKYIQPYVSKHGGHIKYHGFKDGVVYVTMFGSCVDCPSASSTLYGAVYNILRFKVPEVNEIRNLSSSDKS